MWLDYVTWHYDIHSCDCDTFPYLLCVVSSKEKTKEKKRNINNDWAILPSHNNEGNTGRGKSSAKESIRRNKEVHR